MSKERREARRAFYERKEKEAYRLLKRINEISSLAHGHCMGTQMVTLDKPIRKGWVRFYKVRDDFARSPEGPMLAEVLKFAQHSVTCDRKDFTTKVWRKKKTYKPVEQELAELSEKFFLENVPERLRRYFYRTYRISQWGGQEYVVYRVVHPWKFSFVIKPHYITKVPMTSSEAESEYKKLSDKMWRQDNLTMRYMDHSSEFKDMKDSPKTHRPKIKAALRKEAEDALAEREEDKRDSRQWYWDWDDDFGWLD